MTNKHMLEEALSLSETFKIFDHALRMREDDKKICANFYAVLFSYFRDSIADVHVYFDS